MADKLRRELDEIKVTHPAGSVDMKVRRDWRGVFYVLASGVLLYGVADLVRALSGH